MLPRLLLCILNIQILFEEKIEKLPENNKFSDVTRHAVVVQSILEN